MTRFNGTLAISIASLAWACGTSERPPLPPVDCSIEERYEFLNISNFSGTESGWFQYADPTPGGLPDVTPCPEGVVSTPENPCGSNILVSQLEPPGRCGDTRFLKLEMEGKNFWGAGFGDWAHNAPGTRAPDGTDYDGISFWARGAPNAEKVFIFNVDDGRTIINAPEVTADNACPANPTLPVATANDQDLDGDGCIGPGDIVSGTQCRLPPPSDLGEAACYNGGADSPASAGVRVPVEAECGNAFHTRIVLTDSWQLFLIPWDELVQWPCPNRLGSSIRRDDVAKFEIRLTQGMRYEIWLDNIAFYRPASGN